MSLRGLLGKLLLYVVLELGAFGGVHMRPDEIEKLMNIHHRTVATEMQKKDDS